MFGKGKKSGEPSAEAQAENAKISARQVLDHLMTTLTTDQGVHIESLVTALGALAGRACQFATLDGLSSKNPDYDGLSLLVVGGANGDQYYYGDAINRPLAESPQSVWALLASPVVHFGGELPDFGELFSHSAATVGGPQFGRPRYAEGTDAAETPREYVRLWNDLLPIVCRHSPGPQQWPLAYGYALQRLFAQVNAQLDLGVLARVAMDSAIATSRLKV
jgi:hypothetical protein